MAVDSGYVAKLDSRFVSPTGVFGGYLVAIAMRAAAEKTQKARVLTAACEFTAPAAAGEVHVAVDRRHSGRSSELLQVSMTQHGKLILSCQFRNVDPREGVPHPTNDPPSAPPPGLLRPMGELHKKLRGLPFLEVRPIYEAPLGRSWPECDPPWTLTSLRAFTTRETLRLRFWVRIVPLGAIPDGAGAHFPVVLAIDWLVPFTAALRYMGERLVLHSTMSLLVEFHPAPASDWYLCEAIVSGADAGIAHGSARVWSHDGSLAGVAAVSMQQRVVF